MRTHTLVIPGLLWPADSVGEALRGLTLPNLSALLGRAQVRTLPPCSLDELLAREAGLDPATAPWGALRLAGLGVDPGHDVWMCADPTHLRLTREAVTLADARELDLSAEDAAEFVAALNRDFADVGEFHATTPTHWHLKLASQPALATHSVDAALGRNIQIYLPDGADAAHWRKLINEMQMALHAHPRNAAREAARKLALNSLWPWGAGRMPEALALPFDAVYADEPLARGLALAAGLAPQVLPQSFSAPEGVICKSLIYRHFLFDPWLYQDFDAWRAALTDFETHWCAPLVAALKRKRVDSLRVLAPGNEQLLELTVTSAGWWKFWHKPRTLDQLIRNLPAP